MAHITPDNLLLKLAFAVSSNSMERLKDELNVWIVEHANGPASTVSRATIHNWFRGKNLPTRSKGIGVIREFAEHVISGDRYRSFTPDQKKVLKQVVSYCRENNAHRGLGPIDIEPGTRGMVRIHQNRIMHMPHVVEDIGLVEGFYNVYRPILRHGDPRVAQEVLRIRRVGSGALVRWWYLLDGSKLQRFEGMTVFASNFAWLISYDAHVRGRLQAACIALKGLRTGDFAGGAVLDTSPNFTDPVPTSMNIVVERVLHPNKKATLGAFVHMIALDDIADGAVRGAVTKLFSVN